MYVAIDRLRVVSCNVLPPLRICGIAWELHCLNESSEAHHQPDLSASGVEIVILCAVWGTSCVEFVICFIFGCINRRTRMFQSGYGWVRFGLFRRIAVHMIFGSFQFGGHSVRFGSPPSAPQRKTVRWGSVRSAWGFVEVGLGWRRFGWMSTVVHTTVYLQRLQLYSIMFHEVRFAHDSVRCGSVRFVMRFGLLRFGSSSYRVFRLLGDSVRSGWSRSVRFSSATALMFVAPLDTSGVEFVICCILGCIRRLVDLCDRCF
jgi:hypothetical protein